MNNTKSNHLIPIFVLLILVAVLFGLAIMAFRNSSAKTVTQTQTTQMPGKQIPFYFGDQRIELNGETLAFSNGSYALGTHTATIAERTVNAAGTHAAALLLDQPGGSGTFFYVLGAMQGKDGQVFSKPVLIGDRVKFESMTVGDDGTVVVNILDRASGEPMSTEPTVKRAVKFTFQADGSLTSAR